MAETPQMQTMEVVMERDELENFLKGNHILFSQSHDRRVEPFEDLPGTMKTVSDRLLGVIQ